MTSDVKLMDVSGAKYNELVRNGKERKRTDLRGGTDECVVEISVLQLVRLRMFWVICVQVFTVVCIGGRITSVAIEWTRNEC